MTQYARIANGVVVEMPPPPPADFAGIPLADLYHEGLTWVDVTADNPQPQVGWIATQSGQTWTFAAPPPPPPPTLAQQAQEALSAGLAVSSTGTPAINATYACDPASQPKYDSMYNLIQRANGSFPGGLTALPWPDITGTPRVFPTVALWLELATAMGNYILALDLIAITNSGTLPPSSVTLA